MNQQDLGLNLSTWRTRKTVFLQETERVVPWAKLFGLIALRAQRTVAKWPALALEVKLRIYLQRRWIGLSGVTMDEAPFDVSLCRQFAGFGDRERIFDLMYETNIAYVST